jgi:hypothetical protein
MAADALIAANGRFSRHDLRTYDDALHRKYPAATRTPNALAGTASAIGRALLGSKAFTRHVVIDRWFLRSLPFSAEKPPHTARHVEIP